MSYQKAMVILTSPERYSRKEVEKARALLRDAARNEKRQARMTGDD